MARSSSRRRGGTRAKRGRRTAAGLHQSPWRSLPNPYRPIEVLAPERIEVIHDASLRVLGEIEMDFSIPRRWRSWVVRGPKSSRGPSGSASTGA